MPLRNVVLHDAIKIGNNTIVKKQESWTFLNGIWLYMSDAS